MSQGLARASALGKLGESMLQRAKAGQGLQTRTAPEMTPASWTQIFI